MLFKKMPSISTIKLEKLLPDKPTILDVREPDEYKMGHIPGAKNVPLATIGEQVVDGPAYIVCQSGGRSSHATKILRRKGCDAINVAGGMNNWEGEVKKGNKI